jgi:hypothetical protein
MVWATSRSPASYTLVWAVTVVRPRWTGTATARTDPPVTGRNMWLVEVIVAVVFPRPVRGRLLRTRAVARAAASTWRSYWPAIWRNRLPDYLIT